MSRNMAADHCLPLPLICVCSPKKESVEQITVGTVELDLEKLKVRPTLRLYRLVSRPFTHNPFAVFLFDAAA